MAKKVTTETDSLDYQTHLKIHWDWKFPGQLRKGVTFFCFDVFVSSFFQANAFWHE